jgi:hypothetical protein
MQSERTSLGICDNFGCFKMQGSMGVAYVCSYGNPTFYPTVIPSSPLNSFLFGGAKDNSNFVEK